MPLPIATDTSNYVILYSQGGLVQQAWSTTPLIGLLINDSMKGLRYQHARYERDLFQIPIWPGVADKLPEVVARAMQQPIPISPVKRMLPSLAKLRTLTIRARLLGEGY